MNRTCLILTAAAFLAPVFSPLLGADRAVYRSPYDIAFAPDGKSLAVTDRDTSVLTIIDCTGAEKGSAAGAQRDVVLAGPTRGVAWSADGTSIFVAEYGAGTVAEIDAQSAQVRRRLKVGLRPVGVAVAQRRHLLVAANTVTDDISVVDLESGAEKARIGIAREPFFVAITPDESIAVVGNLLPAGSAADPSLAATVALVDLERLEKVAEIRLPAGSTSVREVAISPDGRWAYTVHTVGRFNVPSTQLERGWVNTNAMSILDLQAKCHYATVLLDHPYEGATDPWGIALSKDGAAMWISLRGVHQVARIDLAKLHHLLEGELPDTLAAEESYSASSRSIWLDIKQEPAKRELLVNDLSALYAMDLIERLPVAGKGPRGLDLSPSGESLAVAVSFSSSVVLADPATGKTTATIQLGPPREPDLARRGEILFHDATLCFQHWLSCSTCHPDNGRTDGLRWDLTSDGLGTPQRTRSLLLSYKIHPTTARGTRANIEDSVPKGLLFFLHVPEPEIVEPLIAYLKSLEPEPSPFLVDGELSESARRGQELFQGKAKCSHCHTGELHTDLKAHNVGTRGEFDRPDDLFYTPKLVELYRTAPYLHDGRAATLMDVLTIHDPNGKHGKTSKLTPAERDDLIEYLQAL